MKKRILSIILTLSMVVLLSLNSLPVYAAGTTLSVGSFTELQTVITTTATDGDIIEITAPISITATLVITKNLTFTASGTGKLTRDSSFTDGRMFTIGTMDKSATVTFQDIIIDGNNVNANRAGVVIDYGELIFQSGAVLQNCRNSNVFGYGGGIGISGAYGTFTMNGGTIQNNYSSRYGGGVIASNNGNFTMTGGRIINNTVGNTGEGGGIYLSVGVTAKISGEVNISGNTKGDGNLSNNLFMETSELLEITGPLTNITPIGVSSYADVFTKDTGENYALYISKFVSDDTACSVQIEGNQLKLVQNSYPVTIAVNRDGVAWADYGKSFKLVKSSTDYTNLTAIPGGTYDIYEGSTDTGVEVTVNGAAASATVDYYTVTLTKGEGIASTSGGGTYLKNSSPSINATVNVNYNWSKWTQTTGGAEVSTTNSYTITNIESAQSYTATAVKAPPTIGNIPDQTHFLTECNLSTELTKPTVSEGGFSISLQGWQSSLNGVDSWSDIPSGGTCTAGINEYYVRYYATYNDSGTKVVYSPNIKQIFIDRYTPYLTIEATPASPQISGTAVTLKATISNGTRLTAQGYLNTVPVTFKNGLTTLGTAKISATTGFATLETTEIPVGINYITVEFPGDSDFNTAAISAPATYTITAPDPDIATVASAKIAAENASYSSLTQAAATIEEVIKSELKAVADTAVNNSSVTTTINQVSYTAPVAGTSANPSGTNGIFNFTVRVEKGAHNQVTEQKSISITATPYTGITDVQAIAAADSALINGTVNVAFGADQTAKTEAVQNYVNRIISSTGDAAGVTATVVYNSTTEKYDVTLNKGSINGSKSLTMTVNVAPAPPAPPAPYNPPAPADDTKKTAPKTITVVEVPQSIPEKELLSVEPVGEAFDKSVEVKLKEDTIAEDMVRTAMASVSSDLDIETAQIFPLDISIYLKGTDTKVQPKEGTAVMITCPIPKEMLNNIDKLVVVCIINGELQVLPATLVMKDGIQCVQFTASHFSPYAFIVDKDNNLADYVVGTSPNTDTGIITKLTTKAGSLTKLNLEGIEDGSIITYHVCTPTLISVDNDGNVFAKKAGKTTLMANVSYGGTTTLYTINVTVTDSKGDTKIGAIRYYDDIITYNKIKYRITEKASDKVEGTVAVANNQVNKKLPGKVVIPETITYNGKTYKVTSIDESAFYNLNKITSVTIPAGVQEISATAFVSCDSLKTFTVSSDNKHYSAKKGMLLNKKGSKLIAYPSAKGNIVIDKKVAVIGSYSFSACKQLTGVVIPKTVNRIEGCAFSHSKYLTNVTFQGTKVPEIPHLCVFDNVNKEASILVPKKSLLKYQEVFKNARILNEIKVVSVK